MRKDAEADYNRNKAILETLWAKLSKKEQKQIKRFSISRTANRAKDCPKYSKLMWNVVSSKRIISDIKSEYPELDKLDLDDAMTSTQVDCKSDATAEFSRSNDADRFDLYGTKSLVRLQFLAWVRLQGPRISLCGQGQSIPNGQFVLDGKFALPSYRTCAQLDLLTGKIIETLEESTVFAFSDIAADITFHDSLAHFGSKNYHYGTLFGVSLFRKLLSEGGSQDFPQACTELVE